MTAIPSWRYAGAPAQGEEREALLKQVDTFHRSPVNAWSISDLDLIGVGAFSPLQGFLNEQDYKSVVSNMRLSDGTVWSIPVTLAVDEDTAAKLVVGEKAALVGEEDGVVYGVIDVESVYQVDQQVEAVQVFKTDDPEHPGVKSFGTTCDVCWRSDSSIESSPAGTVWRVLF